MKLLNRIETYFIERSAISTYILQYSLAFVFVWFGWSGIYDTGRWIAMVPAWTNGIAAPETLVVLHGIFELCAGLLLFTRRYTRIIAFILAVDLTHILFLVSGPTLIRDIGLVGALLALAFHKK